MSRLYLKWSWLCFALGAICFLGACKTPPALDSETQTFVDRTLLRERRVDFVLESLKKDPIGKTIYYEVYEEERAITRFGEDVGKHKDRNISHSVKIRFPKLNRKEFDFLKQHYGQNSSKVLFKEGEVYHLADFFQPPIQALENSYHFYKDSTEPATNCWSSAYEISVFNSKDYDLYVSNDAQMLKMLENSDFATALGPNDSLKPQDLVIEWAKLPERNMINHAWVYLDQGIRFEKESTSPSNFRMTFEAPLASKVKYNGDGSSTIVYRINREKAPRGAGVFQGFNPNSPLIVQKHPYHYDALGRASFKGEHVVSSQVAYDQGLADIKVNAMDLPLNQENWPTFKKLQKTHGSCLYRGVYKFKSVELGLVTNSFLNKVQIQDSTINKLKFEFRVVPFENSNASEKSGIKELSEDNLKGKIKGQGFSDITVAQGPQGSLFVSATIDCNSLLTPKAPKRL